MIRTLVIEDEKVAAAAHAAAVEATDGFELVGTALSAQEAARLLRTSPVDLVLLDLHLPDGHGLELLRQLRGVGARCDVIAVTSARDVAVVRDAVSQGVVAYLIKPFAPGALHERLNAYRAYREGLTAAATVDQAALDRALGTLRAPTDRPLPKGLSAESLRDVVRVLHDLGPSSAGQVADALGASRVTARRYLEHLSTTGRVERATRWGRTGRPEVEYRPLVER